MVEVESRPGRDRFPAAGTHRQPRSNQPLKPCPRRLMNPPIATGRPRLRRPLLPRLERRPVGKAKRGMRAPRPLSAGFTPAGHYHQPTCQDWHGKGREIALGRGARRRYLRKWPFFALERLSVAVAWASEGRGAHDHPVKVSGFARPLRWTNWAPFDGPFSFPVASTERHWNRSCSTLRPRFCPPLLELFRYLGDGEKPADYRMNCHLSFSL
jgi:hypothetical protein